MDQWIATLPKTLFAFIAISLGIAFIILSDPPHTLCDSQVESFLEDQEGFLKLKKKQSAVVNPETGEKRKTAFEEAQFMCKRGYGPGGCLELILKLGQLRRQLDQVSRECREQVFDLPLVKNAIWTSLDLFIKIAWGEKPPEGGFARRGWFQVAEMSEFCQYKRLAQTFYGREAWNQNREKWMTSLPGSESMNRTQIWERILISEKCDRFL